MPVNPPPPPPPPSSNPTPAAATIARFRFRDSHVNIDPLRMWVTSPSNSLREHPNKCLLFFYHGCPLPPPTDGEIREVGNSIPPAHPRPILFLPSFLARTEPGIMRRKRRQIPEEEMKRNETKRRDGRTADRVLRQLSRCAKWNVKPGRKRDTCAALSLSAFFLCSI